MELLVNGKPVTLPETSTLTGLLEQLALEHARVAIEGNREIVPRSQHAGYRLKAGDQVEIVQAIGGG